MRASASATASSAMSSARACCCIWFRRRRKILGKAYKTVRAELDAYGNGLTDKVEIVALTQVDTLDADQRKKKVASLKRAAGRAPMLLSAVTGEGVRGGAARPDGGGGRGACAESPAPVETRWNQ